MFRKGSLTKVWAGSREQTKNGEKLRNQPTEGTTDTCKTEEASGKTVLLGLKESWGHKREAAISGCVVPK